MTLFVVLMLPIVVRLGIWQLDRAEFKQGLEMSYLSQLAQLPVPPPDELTPFSRVRLVGQFSEQIFLLDNQVHNGTVGYWVIQGFETEDDVRFLVNRGFIAGAREDRQKLPHVSTPQGQLTLVAMVWPFTGLIPLLDEDKWDSGWPKRVQRLDVAKMASTIDGVAQEMRLEAGQPGVLQTAPFAQSFDDSKHQGYAATWFGLAVTLFCGFVIFGFVQGRGITGEK